MFFEITYYLRLPLSCSGQATDGGSEALVEENTCEGEEGMYVGELDSKANSLRKTEISFHEVLLSKKHGETNMHIHFMFEPQRNYQLSVSNTVEESMIITMSS